MKIDIATVATPDIQQYAKYSVALNADYAIRHEYGFHVFTTPSKLRSPTWGKVEIAKQLLSACDWLFFIDADAIFVNLDKKLEDFTKIDGDLLVCENGPNGGRPLNTGAMFLKNTNAMHRFLDTWYETGVKYAFKHFHEQEALNDYYEKISTDSHAIKIVPLPYDTFNGHWLDYQKPVGRERFVVHVMQRCNQERAEFFKRVYEMRNRAGAPEVAMDPLIKSSELIVEDMDGEILLYRPSTHKTTHLNGSAALIWKLCDGTRTVEDVVECLGAEFPNEKSTIAQEVQETIDLLIRDGALVERS